jgi:DNA polymerase-3 subunit beta
MAVTALVPARTLAEAAKSLTSGAELSIALSASAAGEGLIGLAGGERSTTSRLLDGEFPKYRSLLPETSTATASVDVSALTDAVRRVALVASRTSPIRLSFSEEGISLEAGGLDDAAATETLLADFEGEALTIAFNATYLLDGLGSLDSDAATLSFTGPTKPAVLTGKTDGDGGTDHRYLLMPVRLAS